MSWAAVAGAAVSVVGGLVAKNNGPKAAGAVQYQNVDPQAEQTKALQGNLDNAGTIEQLLSRTDKYSQNQASQLMESALPGYGKLSQTLLGQFQKQATNPYDVPQDVQDNLTRIAAERGIQRGTAGQTNQYSLLRDLGVNQLQYGQTQLASAMQGLTQLSGISPRVSPASPLSFYLTPQQAISATTNNNTQNQAINQGAANSNATMNNFANQNMWDSILKGVGTAAGAFGGSDGSVKNGNVNGVPGSF